MSIILLWTLVALIITAFIALAVSASISSARESREAESTDFSHDGAGRDFDFRRRP